MRLRQTGMLSMVVAVVAAIAVLAFVVLRPGDDRPPRAAAMVGGAFSLVDQNGGARTEADFRGALSLVFFGYTNCPDVCPTALNDVSLAMTALGAAADRVRPVFITVDPARDTPERLRDYLANFDSRLIALTGTEATVAAAARAYRVFYARSKPDEDGDYTVDHSAIFYLMAADGSYLTHLPHNAGPKAIVAAIRRHVN